MSANDESSKLADSNSPAEYGAVETKSPRSARESQSARLMEEGIVQQYDMNDLITLRVFGLLDGTILKSTTLWKETLATGVLYWITFIIFYANRQKGFSDVVGSEAGIRAFIGMFSTFIALLLSFYTALNLGRWWQMRTGVSQIQEGCKKLICMMAPLCKDEKDHGLLQTIQRYARASLFLIFKASQSKEDGKSPLEQAVKAELINEEEAGLLKECNSRMSFVQAETLWAWLGNAVTQFNSKPDRVKGPPHYCALMGAVELGRSGIGEIQAFLETPIPLAYVHLLCVIIKLHNIILTLLMAMECTKHAGQGTQDFRPVHVIRVTFRAFFMPFLYNALLVLNAEMVDPFGEDKTDFQWDQYDTYLEEKASAFVQANKKVPSSLNIL